MALAASNTVVAAHAGNLIGELTLAMKSRIGLKTIGATIHPNPRETSASRPTGVDKQRADDSPVFVRRLRSSIALMLLALWMPATQYCELEIAGVFVACACCHDEQKRDDGGRDCDADGCAIEVNAGYRLSGDVFLAKVPAPSGGLLLVFAFAPQSGVAPLIRLDGTAAPRALARSWQFARRAAPPSRAPAVVV